MTDKKTVLCSDAGIVFFCHYSIAGSNMLEYSIEI